MRVTDLIEKKKHGQPLARDEIRYFVQAYVDGRIADYQASALLMAIWFSGMDDAETLELTMAMAESGDQIDLAGLPGIIVDKHSTGGVADTTTLIAAPLVAACGGQVAKMSGRGLGHTGGTLDKLESIPGFSVDLGLDAFVRTVQRCGLSVIGQTVDLVPADRKLYSLRDVTGTVDNFSLIASSIMSKKLAAGAPAIVLDVKTGSGAFMRDPGDAEALAHLMVDIGIKAGRKTIAFVTDMNQPLGRAVGNALEVRESLEVLKGERREDLAELSFALAAEMLILGGCAGDKTDALAMVRSAIDSGAAIDKLACMISAQGGNAAVVERPDLLPTAARTVRVRANRQGYVARLDTEQIGKSAQILGAGRIKKTDVVDPAVGLWMEKRLGDFLERGESLAVLHVNDSSQAETAARMLLDAVHVEDSKPEVPPLIYGRIGAEGSE